MTDGAHPLRVEVAYAEADSVWSREVVLPPGATIRQAIEASGIRREWPDVHLSDDCVGIFGRRCHPLREVRDGDRVEIYRPLRRNPMDARRRRARGPA